MLSPAAITVERQRAGLQMILEAGLSAPVVPEILASSIRVTTAAIVN